MNLGGDVLHWCDTWDGTGKEHGWCIRGRDGEMDARCIGCPQYRVKALVPVWLWEILERLGQVPMRKRVTEADGLGDAIHEYTMTKVFELHEELCRRERK